MGLPNACPKPTPRVLEKMAKRAAEAKEMRDAYAKADRRDGPQCRICQRRVGGLGMLERRHHHHMRFRSLGGEHESANILSTCAMCHSAIHNAEIRLSGDADVRDERGRLAGVLLERYADGGWKPERML